MTPIILNELAIPVWQPFVPDGAHVSSCNTYRTLLWRDWKRGGRGLLWIMLNPSTADASNDDPTVRKVRGFTRRAGYDWFAVVNLYSYRATKPSELWAAMRSGVDVEGPGRDRAILCARVACDGVVAAWGANAKFEGAPIHVMSLCGVEMLCLGTTKDGHPRHPLMVPYSQGLVPLTG